VITNGWSRTVPSLNETFASRLELLGLRIPELFLPKPSVERRSWSVVACDQYTSDNDYWNTVESTVAGSPSTLRLVLPEIYLGSPDVPDRVRAIHAAMGNYLEQGILESQGECAVYVRRTTARSGLREGLVIAVDLERYDYSSGSKSLIRATEGTIVDRIPPRLAVRRDAPLELPHIMVLVEDAERQLIEGLGARRGKLHKLYDVELMQQGGHLEGYRLDKEADIDGLLTRLGELLERAKQRQHTEQPLFWAMGDGNHSLATAKANWEQVKQARVAAGHTTELADHPARFALVEIVNVYSTGLRFEPIHRVIFTDRTEAALLTRGASQIYVSLGDPNDDGSVAVRVYHKPLVLLIWIGAVVTALLFTVGKFLIGFYIGRSGVTSGFGAAGSLVVLLLWVYYSAQVFLMGAEFTWAYSLTFGSRRDQPVPMAAPVIPSQATTGRPEPHMIGAKEAAAEELDEKHKDGLYSASPDDSLFRMLAVCPSCSRRSSFTTPLRPGQSLWLLG